MTKHDFTGKSIKCDTWEQMQHLAKLAEVHGYSKLVPFSARFFNTGNVYFTVDDKEYIMLDVACDPIETTYSDFINTLPTEAVEVTGCEDCPMYKGDCQGFFTCRHPKQDNSGMSEFDTCPLKKASLTIQLKQNDTTGN
jgi:hypothetical protein